MINADFLSFVRVCNAAYDEKMVERCRPTETLYTRRYGTACPQGGCVNSACAQCPCFFSAGAGYVECDCPNNPDIDADLPNLSYEED